MPLIDCPKCNERVGDLSSHCMHCGTSLEISEANNNPIFIKYFFVALVIGFLKTFFSPTFSFTDNIVDDMIVLVLATFGWSIALMSIPSAVYFVFSKIDDGNNIRAFKYFKVLFKILLFIIMVFVLVQIQFIFDYSFYYTFFILLLLFSVLRKI